MKKVIKEKNESKIKTKSKILVLGLVLTATLGVGFFGPIDRVNAQLPSVPATPGIPGTTLPGTPVTSPTTPGTGRTPEQEKRYKNCKTAQDRGLASMVGVDCASYAVTGSIPGTRTANQSPFDIAVSKNECGAGWATFGGSFAGCILH